MSRFPPTSGRHTALHAAERLAAQPHAAQRVPAAAAQVPALPRPLPRPRPRRLRGALPIALLPGEAVPVLAPLLPQDTRYRPQIFSTVADIF